MNLYDNDMTFAHAEPAANGWQGIGGAGEAKGEEMWCRYVSRPPAPV